MNDLIDTRSVLFPHDIGALGHGMIGLATFWWVATESPVKLTGIYLGVWTDWPRARLICARNSS